MIPSEWLVYLLVSGLGLGLGVGTHRTVTCYGHHATSNVLLHSSTTGILHTPCMYYITGNAACGVICVCSW